MTEQESMAAKIQKLLSLALNNSNPAEAEAAMAKAKDLMVKHAIEEHQLRGTDTEIEIDVLTVNIGRYFENWMRTVQSAVANLFNANVYNERHSTADRCIFVCAASDIDSLNASYIFCVSSILRESAKISGANGRGNSFRQGAADGLYRAIADSKAPKMSADTAAIVLVRSEAIDKASKEMFPNVRTVNRKVKVGDMNAYREGWQFGNKMNAKDSKKLSE
jgi:hypothetical protein